MKEIIEAQKAEIIRRMKELDYHHTTMSRDPHTGRMKCVWLHRWAESLFKAYYGLLEQMDAIMEAHRDEMQRIHPAIEPVFDVEAFRKQLREQQLVKYQNQFAQGNPAWPVKEENEVVEKPAKRKYTKRAISQEIPKKSPRKSAKAAKGITVKIVKAKSHDPIWDVPIIAGKKPKKAAKIAKKTQNISKNRKK